MNAWRTRTVKTSIAAALGGVALSLWGTSCSDRKAEPPRAAPQASAGPSILLVTLDTTRADAVGPEARGVESPAFNALAARGLRFRQAYAAVPETLPSHVSMWTGLLPAGHGVHENARPLARDRALAAERLKQAGYRTAAFVSSFVLARRFGLARGFDSYDDAMPEGAAERSAHDTTERALAYLARESRQPLLLWVHYYDPHYPYAPPEPFRTRYRADPYRGEVAAMDAELGRLVAAFEARATRGAAILVVADHGEGLGEHGEAQHGRLLYQSTMHVPLVLVGPGVIAGVSDVPVSTRRVHDTLLDWAGLGGTASLRAPKPEIVLGEAMKPFLDYGWQPQVMAVEGRVKAIRAGRLEAYDLAQDPGETRDVAETTPPSREARSALLDYPIPAATAPPALDALGDEERRKLASLGYVGSGASPVVRPDAPRPADMSALFEIVERASFLFVEGEYARAVPLFERVLASDPYNLDAALRLASAHSALGHDARAVALFQRAAAIAPGSPDVETYLALHYARGPEWRRAEPLLEHVLAGAPDRLPALEALAVVRERQGRARDAVALRRSIYALREPSAAELVRLGELSMAAGETGPALEAFESARSLQGPAFRHDLELGVLYLSERRLAEAKDALDRVPARDPRYPMALFKRAQLSALLHEPDQQARIDAARRGADATTRELIEKERLFRTAP